MTRLTTAIVWAAAVSAACIPAAAQSTITIYGVADLGLAIERGGPDGTETTMASGIQSGSRVGIRGTEELGAGLKASFVFEAGIDATTGASTQSGRTFGRQSWFALEGDLGTLRLGRQYTPLYLAVDSLDPLESIGEGSGNLLPLAGSRMDSTISYTTPTVGGFSALLAYGFGDNDDADANRQIGVLGAYESDSLVVKLAYHDARNDTDTDSERNLFLGGAYDFERVKLFLGYGGTRGLGTRDERDALIGIQVPIGRGTVMAEYVRKEDRSSAGNDADLVGIGYSYALSKNTNLYTSVIRIRNENTLVYTTRAGDGSGDTEFNLGLRHEF